MFRRTAFPILWLAFGCSSALAQYVSLSSDKYNVANFEQYTVSASFAGANQIQLQKNGVVVFTSYSSTLSYPTSDNYGNETGHVALFALAFDSFGAMIATSDGAVIVTVNQDTTPPSAPTGLQATQITGTSCLLSWTASTDNRAVTGYAIVADGGTPSATITGTMARVTGLTDGVTHSLQVKARDAEGNWSALSTGLPVATPDITVPTTPGTPIASNITTSGCTLLWPGSSDNVGVSVYSVRRDGTPVDTTTGTSTSITGLVAGRTYSFTVQARDTAGNYSAESNAVQVTALTPYGTTDITISNTSYGNQTVMTAGMITAKADVPGNPCNVTVTSGGYAKYVAGAKITLGDGFRALSGSTFIGRVGSDNTDSDADGMSDLWELTNGLNPNSAADALLDPDADGLTNVAEHNLKLDPYALNEGAASTGGALPANWPTPDGSTFEAVGITSGELSVGPSGAASYSIPIWVSPGTAGMEPKLTINYSSQSGAGLLGWGWSLGGLSAISRGPQSLAVDGASYVPGVNLAYTDRFYMDGQRLINVPSLGQSQPGTYGANGTQYSTEIDSFSRVISNGTAGSGPEWFKVWTKAGLIIEFGNTADSRLMAGSTVRTWAVSKIADTFGNYMEFVYTNETNANGAQEQRLSRINYTGHTGGTVVSPYASVRVEYENRLDTSEGYFLGYRYGSTKRVSAIKSYYGEIALRTYKFAYTERPYTYRSMLASITEVGKDFVELKPLTFQYSEATEGWTAGSSSWNLSIYTDRYMLADNDSKKPMGAGFVDFNGDGRTDFLFRNNDTDLPHPAIALRNAGAGWATESAYTPPYKLTREDGLDSGTRFVDVNGDGLVDLLWRHSMGGAVGARLNTGSGWSADNAAWYPPSRVATNDEGRKGGQFMDMNGDGRVDFVAWIDPAAYNYPIYVFLNTGTGWNTVPESSFASVPNASFDLGDKKTQFVDFNGDGLPDMVTYFRSGDGSSDSGALKGAWRNTGSGWAWAPEYIPLRYIACADYGMVGTEFVDANGDGLADQVWSLDGYPTNDSGSALNTGVGWQSASYAPTSYLARLVGTEMRPSASYVDVNADGLVDIAGSYYNSGGFLVRGLSLGTGHGYFAGPLNSRLEVPLSFSTTPQKGAGVDLVDLNGDGAVDTIERRKNDNGTNTNSVWINNASQADRLIKVTNGFGVEAQITYKPLTDSTIYTKAANLDGIETAEQPNVANLPAGAMLAVATVVNDDGASGSYIMSYQYGGMRSHRVRGSLGFGWMTVLDTRTNILSTTEFNQNFPFVGSPVETFTTTNGGSGTILSESTTTFDKRETTTAAGHKYYFPFAKSSIAKSRDLDGGLTSATQTITQRGSAGDTSDYDTYGNSKYIEVNSAITFTGSYPNEVPDYTGGYRKITVNNYANTISVTQWWLGRLSDATVTSSAPGVPTLTRKSAFLYTPNIPNTGVLSAEIVEPDSADATVKLTTTYTYDEFGNKTGVSTQGIGGSARTASTTYDTNYPQGRFPVSSTNALGTVTTLAANPWWGTLDSSTVHGQTVTSLFDDFGRPIRETSVQHQTYTTTQRKWAFGNAPAGAKYYVQTQAFRTTDNAVKSAPAVEFFDKLGRSIRKLGVNGDGRAVASEPRYDAMGRAHKTFAPFYADQTPTIWTETVQYDLLGRPLQVRTPDDEAAAGYVTTTYQYGSRAVLGAQSGTIGSVGLVTNPKGVTTRNTTNSQGWTVEIVQNADNDDLDPNTDNIEQATLTKSYDALGQLLQSNAAGTIITHEYDVRGRRKKTIDPNMGTWEYGYDVFGEPNWQKDANNNITVTGYDAAGRPTDRTITPGQVGVDSERTEWTYYTSGANLELLDKVETYVNGTAPANLEYRETYAYDALRRPTTVTRRIDGADHVSTVQYDSYGRPYRTVYPNTGFTTENRYNNFGVVKEVRRVDGGLNQVLWMTALADAYNAAGGLETFHLGNGVATERIVSEATGRLRGINTGVKLGANVQALDYDYDVLGNVLKREDFATTQRHTAEYDALNRLTRHLIVDNIYSTPAFITVAYEANGNIKTKSDVGTYQYLSTKPNAVTATVGGDYAHADFQYDSNGNMTQGAGRANTWTAFNQVKQINQGGNHSEFRFGAAHERVKQVSHNGTRIYVGSSYEKWTPDGGAYTEHIHWINTPAGRVASYKQRTTGYTETQYHHQDALGSITAVTNAWGIVAQRFAYDAWGKRFDPDNTPPLWKDTKLTWAINTAQMPRGFTDHEHLDDLGLIHMNGRVYDPILGRFLSADSNIDGVEDSQGYNRFSYVQNNPLNATDPTGYLSLKSVVGAVLAGGLLGFDPLTIVAGVLPWTNRTFRTQYAAPILGIATTIVLTPFIGPAGAAAIGGFVSGFAGSMLNGGSVGDAFKSGLVGAATGAFTAGMSGVIHDAFAGGFWNEVGRATAHGLVGGAMSEARGGEFRHGFFGSFAGSALGGRQDTSNRRFGAIAGRTIVAATIGGTVSVISGGKFANGAITSAFQHLYNAEAARTSETVRTTSNVTLNVPNFENPLTSSEVELLVYAEHEVITNEDGSTKIGNPRMRLEVMKGQMALWQRLKVAAGASVGVEAGAGVTAGISTPIVEEELSLGYSLRIDRVNQYIEYVDGAGISRETWVLKLDVQLSRDWQYEMHGNQSVVWSHTIASRTFNWETAGAWPKLSFELESDAPIRFRLNH